jgi:hypothetical protein
MSPFPGETSLYDVSHDEIPHEETSHNETFPGVTCHSGIPPGETFRGALHFGLRNGPLGLYFHYPTDQD